MFLPLFQQYMREMALHIRSDAPPGPLAIAVRREITALGPSLQVPESQLVQTAMADAIALERMGARLLSVFGLLASYVPARRATKIDPMVALRYE